MSDFNTGGVLPILGKNMVIDLGTQDVFIAGFATDFGTASFGRKIAFIS